MERNYVTATLSEIGSMGHLGHLSRPGHRVIILTRCETRVLPVFRKMRKMQNVHLTC